jgi:alpha/beta superfamily hydrolase
MTTKKQRQKIIGPIGNLEAILYLPDALDYSRVGIICHPHPLQDGTMLNKVVTTIAKSFNSLNIPCVTFNFRGVGKSEGIFGNINGEVADCMAVVEWVLQQWPQTELCLAGFSFGAYVAAEVASKVPCKFLITVAPSVERMPYYELSSVTCPWLVIQGDDDEVVDSNAVYKWYDQLQANKSLIKFSVAGHFFHGKLIDLQQQIQEFVQSC